MGATKLTKNSTTKQVTKTPSKTLTKKRNAAFEAIAKKAILVSMERKQISNLPFDVKLSDQVCKTLGVKNNSYVQVRKCLINPQYLINIKSLMSDALIMVWNHTRPWDNVGYRLLPMEFYDDFIKTFTEIKDETEEAIQVFVDNYPDYIKEAKKDLGKAFNKDNYADPSDVKSFFTLEITTSKFPEIDDIRLNLTNDELVDMQNDFVDKYEDAINSSIDSLFKRIKTSTKEECQQLLIVIKKLNVENNAGINMKITTAEEEMKQRFGDDVLKDKDEVNEDNMMMMDDLDDFNDDEIKEIGL